MWKHKSDALEIIANLIDKDAVNGKEALKLAIGVLYDNDRMPISFIDGEPVESPETITQPPIEVDPKPFIYPRNPTAPTTNPNVNKIEIGDVVPDPYIITCTHPDKIDAIGPGPTVMYDGFPSSITGEIKASETVGVYNTKDCLEKH